jgi:predicted regulator of Ras-like GTPase activity (Roadblock/LC7/MglB family)
VNDVIEQTIERIKRTLPEVEHVVMFYNDGTVFHTTFEHKVNIPKLGENISETLTSLKKIYLICNFDLESYNKLVFETNDVNVIILKLGENSNLALFFRKRRGELRIRSIRRYIEKAEELLDVDREELVEQNLEIKEGQLKEFKLQFGSQQYKLITLQEYLKEITEEEKKKQISKEIELVNREIMRIKEEIDKKIDEIDDIKEELRQEEISV